MSARCVLSGRCPRACVEMHVMHAWRRHPEETVEEVTRVSVHADLYTCTCAGEAQAVLYTRRRRQTRVHIRVHTYIYLHM